MLLTALILLCVVQVLGPYVVAPLVADEEERGRHVAPTRRMTNAEQRS